MNFILKTIKGILLPLVYVVGFWHYVIFRDESQSKETAAGGGVASAILLTVIFWYMFNHYDLPWDFVRLISFGHLSESIVTGSSIDIFTFSAIIAIVFSGLSCMCAEVIAIHVAEMDAERNMRQEEQRIRKRDERYAEVRRIRQMIERKVEEFTECWEEGPDKEKEKNRLRASLRVRYDIAQPGDHKLGGWE